MCASSSTCVTISPHPLCSHGTSSLVPSHSPQNWGSGWGRDYGTRRNLHSLVISCERAGRDSPPQPHSHLYGAYTARTAHQASPLAPLRALQLPTREGQRHTWDTLPCARRAPFSGSPCRTSGDISLLWAPPPPLHRRRTGGRDQLPAGTALPRNPSSSCKKGVGLNQWVFVTVMNMQLAYRRCGVG